MKKILLAALCLMTIAIGYAQEPTKAEVKMNEIVKKYENVKGVDCTVVTKGRGIGIVKLMLNEQYGKDFMKGVHSITIIEYSEASEETRLALHKDIDSFKTLLEEFNLKENENYANNDYAKSFAAPINENTISDFLIAIEDKETRMIMYMAGIIKLEK
jgi:hypothetical protein